MRILLVLSLLLAAAVALGQKNNLKVGIGQTCYRGDLSPYTSYLSFGKGHTAITVAYDKMVSARWRLGAEILSSRLSGDDLVSPVAMHRNRGLHFETQLNQGTANLGYRLLEIGGDVPSSGFTAWVSSGVGLVYTNPTAQFLGQRRALREYGTEGQLLDGGTISSNWSLSTPLGLEAEVRINATWAISLHVRYTAVWTDYLDDVSTVYPDMARLKAHGGYLALGLSDRGGSGGIDMMRDRSGQPRGDHIGHDGFLMVGLFLAYRW